ncbi:MULTISPECIES: PepSY domain-containing protein [unclassified Halomonas]|uniref:PepSY domain-containing protein n=1 Tax=unclassified Halomonas TaxID=2609666 RepID=UPI0021E47A77|nr:MULTISPECIES: PepSY domain-containing protein [unclassified Halomonas]UYF99662.1 PepSY domain-containing protein [Halomonas sp. GD1P12]WNL39246.1 PepSY domain-containing protein [Halomonas sp. PAMB 3232]
MKKTAIALAITAIATLGLGQAAMAEQDDYQQALDQAAFANMIEQANNAGVALFREIQIDEERGAMEFEVEGWDAGGQGYELTLNVESGEVMHESSTETQVASWGLDEQSSTPTQVAPWGLDAQQLNSVLDRASQDGFDRFEDIDIDEDGTVDVSGFDGDQREMERSYGLDEFKGDQ